MLLEHGKLCKDCTVTKCDLRERRLECPTCGGKGCGECQHGKITLTKCPYEIIGRETGVILRAARRFEKGLMPIHGGTLDQDNKLVECVDFVSSYTELVKAEK